MTMKIFAYRQVSTGHVVAIPAPDRFQAAEVLCNTYPDSCVDDFDLIVEGNGEFIELILGGFGGVCVMLDTAEK